MTDEQVKLEEVASQIRWSDAEGAVAILAAYVAEVEDQVRREALEEAAKECERVGAQGR